MSGNHDADFQQHVATWNGFTRLVTWGIVIVIAILVGMALTLL